MGNSKNNRSSWIFHIRVSKPHTLDPPTVWLLTHREQFNYQKFTWLITASLNRKWSQPLRNTPSLLIPINTACELKGNELLAKMLNHPKKKVRSPPKKRKTLPLLSRTRSVAGAVFAGKRVEERDKVLVKKIAGMRVVRFLIFYLPRVTEPHLVD